MRPEKPTHLQQRIREELSVLVGQPLWDSLRALDLMIFGFGPRHWVKNRHGDRVAIGHWSLHVEVPWRIIGRTGIVAASDDRFYLANEDDIPDEHSGPTLCEYRLKRWFKDHEASPLTVQAVKADITGGFALRLDRGFSLEVVPCNSLRGGYSTRWSMFSWPRRKRPFVVYGSGAEKGARA